MTTTASKSPHPSADAGLVRAGRAIAIAFFSLVSLAFAIATAGFSNDHFGRIATARQIAQYGELPFRDHFDPGYVRSRFTLTTDEPAWMRVRRAVPLARIAAVQWPAKEAADVLYWFFLRVPVAAAALVLRDRGRNGPSGVDAVSGMPCFGQS